MVMIARPDQVSAFISYPIDRLFDTGLVVCQQTSQVDSTLELRRLVKLGDEVKDKYICMIRPGGCYITSTSYIEDIKPISAPESKLYEIQCLEKCFRSSITSDSLIEWGLQHGRVSKVNSRKKRRFFPYDLALQL